MDNWKCFDEQKCFVAARRKFSADASEMKDSCLRMCVGVCMCDVFLFIPGVVSHVYTHIVTLMIYWQNTLSLYIWFNIGIINIIVLLSSTFSRKLVKKLFQQ